MSMLDHAIKYAAQGWSVIPVLHRSKNPSFKRWEQLRLQKDDLPVYFNGHPQNIGVLMGEPSGWLIDVDLDHVLCVAMADQFLPPTPAVFGRSGKPRSHRLYRVDAPVATKKFKSKTTGMLVELRSTGTQTVFPPSTHESGESIAWEIDSTPAALVEPGVLLEALERMANAVLIKLGERAAFKSSRPAQKTVAAAISPQRNIQSSSNIVACVKTMLRMNLTDHKDGSGRLFAAACRVVEHDLNDAEGIAAIREYANLTCPP